MKNATSNKRHEDTPQVRVALQVDQELADWMRENVKNRNRYICGLIRQDMEQRWVEQLATVRGEHIGETMSHLHTTYLAEDREVDGNCTRRVRGEL